MDKDRDVTAHVKPAKRMAAVWIIPIVSLFAGIWMIYQYASEQGPEITLTVPTAEGIEAGKTLVKARSVKIGIVNNVALSKNYNEILLTVRMDSGTERMLREDTLFWVVKPRIGTEGVSGLETLLSGPYLELRPGESDVKKDKFTVLDSPPVAPADTKGLRVVLTSDDAGKLAIGDPVMYEGYTVGRVEKVGFDIDKRNATYQLFIFQPYDALVRKHTRFWLNSGLDIKLNAEGFSVNVASLESLMIGGVSFGVPDGNTDGSAITEQMLSFKLFDNKKEIREKMYEQFVAYAMLFGESVRGLNPGASVEYRGIRIGTVKKVPLHLSQQAEMGSEKIPVLVHIEMERIYDASLTLSESQLLADFKKAFGHGLRASLKTGNLLTGALYIDTDFYPDSPPETHMAQYYGFNVFPTIDGEFVQFQRQIGTILTKLSKLPLDTTLSSLDDTLSTTQQTLKTFDGLGQDLSVTVRRLDALLKQKDTQQLPKEIQNSLTQLQKNLKGFSPESSSYSELQQALSQVNDALGQLEPLLKTLNDSPDALIFGTSGQNDPVPAKGKRQ
ncbi:paraquat-inducible protein B [Enterovibrio norvegicus FF-33]|uniref:intermembrane transport protein PqiB n=1 Tax=Enterovibrio norvegicus TaxID=188144 RepID=UPI0002E3CD47|nr:intermembrane transport protein PqiB [Enterovibrio norvegicus]OEE66393.1 paraquat-inducible protein B [Enterovibrio norvegicus FF-33]